MECQSAGSNAGEPGSSASRGTGVEATDPSDVEAPDTRLAVREDNPWLAPIRSGKIDPSRSFIPLAAAVLSIKLFGTFNEAVFRFVPALLAVLSTLLMLDLGRILAGRRFGWCSALAWASGYGVLSTFRMQAPESYLAFFTLACAWGWIRASQGGNAPALLGVIAFYGCFALAVLTGGLAAAIGIVLPIVLWQFCDGKPPRFTWRHAAGITLFLAVLLPWPIYLWRHVPNASSLWVRGLSDHFADGRAGALPPLLLLTVPWTLIWLAGVHRQLRQVRERLGFASSRGAGSAAPVARTNRRGWRRSFPLLWLVGWTLASLILPRSDRIGPSSALAPCSLLIAEGIFVAVAAYRRRRARRWLALATVNAVIGLVLAIPVGAIMNPPHAPRTVPPHVENRWLQDFAVDTPAKWAAFVSVATLIALWRRPRLWPALSSLTFMLLVPGMQQIDLALAPNGDSAKAPVMETLHFVHEAGYTFLAEGLPDVAAVYVPPELNYNAFATHVVILIDDEANVKTRARLGQGEPPTPPAEEFAKWAPGEIVTEARRIILWSAPDDARWKAYVLTVQRNGFASAIE